MVQRPDDSRVAGSRRVVAAQIERGSRAPLRRSGPSVHDSEAWSVQHGPHARFLPVRSPPRTVAGPCSNLERVIRLPAPPNCATRKRPAFRCVALSVPAAAEARSKGALRRLQTGRGRARVDRER